MTLIPQQPLARLVLALLLLVPAGAGAGRLDDLALPVPGSRPADGHARLPGEGSDTDGDAAPGGTFLAASAAFPVRWIWVDANRLVGRFAPVPGYYLYRDRVRVLAQDRTLPFDARLSLPPGEVKQDPYFGPQQVFHQPFDVTIDLPPVAAGQARPAFDVVWQGCAEAGLCYPPQRRSFTPADMP